MADSSAAVLQSLCRFGCQHFRYLDRHVSVFGREGYAAKLRLPTHADNRWLLRAGFHLQHIADLYVARVSNVDRTTGEFRRDRHGRVSKPCLVGPFCLVAILPALPHIALTPP
jgi:hypothetical protein